LEHTRRTFVLFLSYLYSERIRKACSVCTNYSEEPNVKRKISINRKRITQNILSFDIIIEMGAKTRITRTKIIMKNLEYPGFFQIID